MRKIQRPTDSRALTFRVAKQLKVIQNYRIQILIISESKWLFIVSRRIPPKIS